ncbi:hypothetical protein KAM380_015960 [Aeromonas caviae]|nr:hypothetical protein KAM380_015960 [Aeromonas caviae]
MRYSRVATGFSGVVRRGGGTEDCQLIEIGLSFGGALGDDGQCNIAVFLARAVIPLELFEILVNL